MASTPIRIDSCDFSARRCGHSDGLTVLKSLPKISESRLALNIGATDDRLVAVFSYPGEKLEIDKVGI